MAEGERVWPWWAAFAAVTAGALWLTWRAYHEALPAALLEHDKLVHFTIAGSCALCLDSALRRRSLRPMFGLLVIFGLEETAQSLSVHRTASVIDYAADASGVLVFTALSRVLSKAGRAKPADDVAK